MKSLVSFLAAFYFINNFPTSLSDGMIYTTKDASRAMRTPDIYKKTPDFFEALGFNVETHMVTTEDGYILNLHRIPGTRVGEVSNEIKGKPVFLIQHGFAGASDSWVLLERKSFPYLLAENGFDVWLGNSRGTYYSRKHLNLTANDKEYWNFSFHEQGLYDLSTTIDYALAVSDAKSLYYVGHSRGATEGFALLASKPEYNKKIRLFIGLAPVVYLRNTKSNLLHALYRELSAPSLTHKFLENAGFYYFPIRNKRGRKLFANLCGGIAFNPCWLLFSQFIGSTSTLNQTRMPVFFSHFPDGDSTKTALHYIQIGQTDRFSQFDLGKNNLRMYGDVQPPAYNLRDVTAPVLLIRAPADLLANQLDMEHLARDLPNVVGFMTVSDRNFNHNDIVWGAESDVLLSKPIIRYIMENGF